MSDNSSLIELTAGIVAAYVSNNSVAAADLPAMIRSTYTALSGAEAPPAPPEEPQVPAVSIPKSIQPDFLICLEDGRKFKSLKRHLRTKCNLIPYVGGPLPRKMLAVIDQIACFHMSGL